MKIPYFFPYDTIDYIRIVQLMAWWRKGDQSFTEITTQFIGAFMHLQGPIS